MPDEPLSTEHLAMRDAISERDRALEAAAAREAALDDAYLALGRWYIERYETLAALDDAAGVPDPDAERIGGLWLDAERLRREGKDLRLTCLHMRAVRREEEG